MLVNKTKKNILIKRLEYNPELYLTLSKEMQLNHDIALATMHANPFLGKYLPKELKKDKEFFKLIFKQYYRATTHVFLYADKSLKEDKELVYDFISHRGGKMSRYVHDNNIHEKIDIDDIFKEVIKEDKAFITEMLVRIDKELIMNFYILLPESIRKDKEIILRCINKDYKIYSLLPPILQDDFEIIQCLMDSSYGSGFSYIHEELREDPFFIITLSQVCEVRKSYLSKELQKEIGHNNIDNFLQSKLLKEKIESELILKEYDQAKKRKVKI